jgi:hypothetical protein
MGFRHVESGPLVRSSYHARDQVPGAAERALRRAATLGPDGRVVPGPHPVVPGHSRLAEPGPAA